MNTKLISSSTARDVGHVVDTLLYENARRAVKYISDKYVVSAARPFYGKAWDKRETRLNVVVKIGAPNYREREFIRRCKKAGEPFPVKKIQLQLLARG